MPKKKTDYNNLPPTSNHTEAHIKHGQTSKDSTPRKISTNIHNDLIHSSQFVYKRIKSVLDSLFYVTTQSTDQLLSRNTFQLYHLNSPSLSIKLAYTQPYSNYKNYVKIFMTSGKTRKHAIFDGLD